eukprot:82174-Chlamydomonas_euryale.AAC.4
MQRQLPGTWHRAADGMAAAPGTACLPAAAPAAASAQRKWREGARPWPCAAHGGGESKLGGGAPPPFHPHGHRCLLPSCLHVCMHAQPLDCLPPGCMRSCMHA